jgi:putative membrane protein
VGDSPDAAGMTAANGPAMNNALRFRLSLVFGLAAALPGCAGDQKAPTQADVADGDALPVAPPVPAQPASTDSPATAPAPVIEQASAEKHTPASSSPSEVALTEGQVAFFADLANRSEVEQGNLAKTRAKSAAVKRFADMMVKHHSESQKEQTALFQKLNLTTTDSGPATALRADAEKTLAGLKDATASDFDRAYIAAQVQVHRAVLQVIDDKLLPAARTAELTAALRKMRSTVEAHLSQAKTLESQL